MLILFCFVLFGVVYKFTAPTCRYIVHHGAYAILSLLVLAEVTSFCQNTWTLANARKGDSSFAAKVFASLSLPFYVLYSVVRGFLGPIFVYQMGVFYLSGVADDVIPRWVSWIVVVVIAICVSVLWILNLWTELFRERSGKIDRKLR